MSFANLHGYNQPHSSDSPDSSGGPKKVNFIERKERGKSDPKQDIILPDVRMFYKNNAPVYSIPANFSEDTTYRTWNGKAIYEKYEDGKYRQAFGYAFVIPWDGLMNGDHYQWDPNKAYALNLDGTKTPWKLSPPYEIGDIINPYGSKLKNYNCVYTYQVFAIVVANPKAAYVSAPPEGSYVVDYTSEEGAAALNNMIRQTISKYFGAAVSINVDTDPVDTSGHITRKFNGRYIGTTGGSISGSKKKYPVCEINATKSSTIYTYKGKVFNFNTPAFKSFKQYVEYCIQCQNTIDWEVENNTELFLSYPLPKFANWWRYYRWEFVSHHIQSPFTIHSDTNPMPKNGNNTWLYPLNGETLDGSSYWPAYGMLHENLICTTYLKDPDGTETSPLFSPWFNGVAMCLNFGSTAIFSPCLPIVKHQKFLKDEFDKIEYYNIPFGRLTDEKKWVLSSNSGAQAGATKYHMVYGLLWSTKMLSELEEES